jgi:broad specificity phosphatase PhoE
MKRTTIALVLLALLTAAPVSAQQVVFVVRHAERASSAAPAAGSAMMADDPPLSAAGEQRAARLAAMLAAADIGHIFTSEYRRTKQTADPIAKQLGITPVSIAAKDPDALIARVRGVEGNALIVGHSNTVPDLLKKLGVAEPVAIGDNDYDNLFVVFRIDAGKATLVRLTF